MRQKVYRWANEVLMEYRADVIFKSQATIEGKFVKKLVSFTKCLGTEQNWFNNKSK